MESNKFEQLYSNRSLQQLDEEIRLLENQVNHFDNSSDFSEEQKESMKIELGNLRTKFSEQFHRSNSDEIKKYEEYKQESESNLKGGLY